jgi:hypothetical protein
MATGFCDGLLDNIDQTCDDIKSLGGLKNTMFAVNWNYIDALTSSTSDNVIDGISLKTDPLTSNPYYFYTIQFKKDTGGFNSELAVGDTRYFTTNVTLKVAGLTSTTLEILEGLVHTELAFIVQDKSGKFFILGKDNSLMASAATVGTGIAQTDLYGSELTFSGDSINLPNPIAAGTTFEYWDGAAVQTFTIPS